MTVGGLATAAMVALLLAPAFACTGQGSLLIWPKAGPVGTPVQVEMVFAPAADAQGRPGDIEIWWGSERDRVAVATVTPDAEGRAKAQFVVPATAKPAFHPISAIQKQANGTDRTSSEVFKVTAVQPPPPDDPDVIVPPGPPPALEPVPAVLSPVQGAPAAGAAGTPAGVTAPSVRRAGAAPSSGPGTDPTGTALPGVVAPGAIPAEGRPAPADPARASQAQPAFSPEAGQDPNAMIGLPSPSDLWSGLAAGQAPSLLDSPAARQDQGAPAGSVLIVIGAALLGGLALVAGRRRLALPARR